VRTEKEFLDGFSQSIAVTGSQRRAAYSSGRHGARRLCVEGRLVELLDQPG
jgi:hypothetical protein